MNTRSTPLQGSPQAGAADELLALDGAAFVRAAYLTLLGRNPDPSGFVACLDRLGAGTSKSQILDSLRQSPEGRMRGALLGPHGLPDSTAAVAGAESGDEVEALLALRGPAFVQHAYASLLGRPVDPSGMAHYSSRLQAGTPPEQILMELALSDEFRQRNRHVTGLDQFVQRNRHLRNPVARAMMRVVRRVRGAAAGRPDAPPAGTFSGPAAAIGAQAATAAPAREPGMAAAVGEARLRLQTLPVLEHREGWRLP